MEICQAYLQEGGLGRAFAASKGEILSFSGRVGGGIPENFTILLAVKLNILVEKHLCKLALSLR